jgi:ornithine cyclodeaminase
MTSIYSLEQIQTVLSHLNLSKSIERGFVAYSQGKSVVPPVGELLFESPPGETHIKYGYIKGDPYFVIKVASGFYENPGLGLSSNSGLMLLFSCRTGRIQAILLDQGYLTDVRTAIAGQIAARYLAPAQVSKIGVLGTGVQARMQVAYLRAVTSCTQVCVWGRTPRNQEAYKTCMEAKGYTVTRADTPAMAARDAQIIITATPSTSPLLFARDIAPGTHITAMGSDTPAKQELDPAILEKADVVVADSLSQTRERGEISHALKQIPRLQVHELGQVIESPDLGRTRTDQITVADLTGVAVQDIQIASTVYQALKKESS